VFQLSSFGTHGDEVHSELFVRNFSESYQGQPWRRAPIKERGLKSLAWASLPIMRAVILIPLLVGLVFLSEGIQKFLFPAALGVGRFEKIGILFPSFSAPLVGVVEIVCGGLVVVGLLTKLASILLLIDICTAIATTKVPVLIKQGFWPAAHETRTDFSMLLGLIFLLIVGGGPLALDALRQHSDEKVRKQ
jgi:uncharacterized membrane protein YphA (DoxX/SURF4 family)